MAKSASYPVISLGLDASGITKGLNAARNILKSGMSSLSSAVSTPLFGVALANQASEFGQKINRLFLEPFRQLMAQEDLFSRFSVLAGGTDKAGKALDQFKGISRQTGISLAELSTSLDTLLQGQFSFAGAVAQIDDLSKVASVLGEGSLPMLTQAAAKFRSNAFVGFEDINQVAASGLPIFEALAQQIGITADEARGLARNGMITGLQARNALNGAAAMGAGANGGQQEQTLSGVVSRLREGLNQTLAEIGKTVSQVIDVPALLNRFRAFLDVVRTLLETAFGPLKNVIGADGGNLKQAFVEAQAVTVKVLKTIGEGFFKFLDGLEKITNSMINLFNWVNGWIGTKFSDAQEKAILDFQNANKIRKVVPQIGPQDIPLPRDQAIERMRQQGLLPEAAKEFEQINLGVNQMRGQFNDLFNGIGKPLDEQQKRLNAVAEAEARRNENLKQSFDALDQYSNQFKDAFTSPLEMALKKSEQLDTLISQAIEAGGDPGDILLQYEDAILALSKGVGDAVDQVNSKFGEIKLASAVSASSTEGYGAIAKFLSGGNNPMDPQEKVKRAVEIQTDINKRQLKAASDTYQAIKNLNVGPSLSVVNF